MDLLRRSVCVECSVDIDFVEYACYYLHAFCDDCWFRLSRCNLCNINIGQPQNNHFKKLKEKLDAQEEINRSLVSGGETHSKIENALAEAIIDDPTSNEEETKPDVARNRDMSLEPNLLRCPLSNSIKICEYFMNGENEFKEHLIKVHNIYKNSRSFSNPPRRLIEYLKNFGNALRSSYFDSAEHSFIFKVFDSSQIFLFYCERYVDHVRFCIFTLSNAIKGLKYKIKMGEQKRYIITANCDNFIGVTIKELEVLLNAEGSLPLCIKVKRKYRMRIGM